MDRLCFPNAPVAARIRNTTIRLIAKLRSLFGRNKEPDHSLRHPSAVAKSYGVPWKTVTNVHDPSFVHELEEVKPTLIVAVRFSQIIKTVFIK